MDFHIDLDTIKLFSVVVIAGSIYGHYLFKKGIKLGWDDAMYSLESAGLIQIDDNGEVLRLSDREYNKIKKEFS